MLTRNVLPAAKKLLAINSRGLAVSAVNRKYDVPEHIDPHRLPPLFIRQPTMDDLPQPCGPWQEYYDKKQRQYNVVLLIGVAGLSLSLIFIYSAGIFRNILTPPKPWPEPVSTNGNDEPICED